MSTPRRVTAMQSNICLSCARIIRAGARRYATIASSRPEIFDVVCVGGGPAGLSLLTALRSSPRTSHLRLALIESQSLDPVRSWSLPRNEFSNRASSLTPASASFLREIGAWQRIDHGRVQAYHHMHVWDALATDSKIDFSAPPPSPNSQSVIAYMTENQNLTRALLAQLGSLEPIATFEKSSVASIHLPPPPPSPETLNLSSYPHITLSSGAPPLAARLLVGADGLNSPVRTFAHIPTRGWDYDRHGVVATVRLRPSSDSNSHASSVPQTHDHATAYQRFLPTGPIALLALPGNYATLVWSTTPTRAAHLKSLSPSDFVAMVNAAFRLCMVDLDYMSTLPCNQTDELAWRSTTTGATTEDSTRYPRSVLSLQENSIASFPLRLRHADRYISSRVALVGDAAHTIHPLAGQGLNMGLADVASLARTIEDTVVHGGDIGVEGNLEGYEGEMWSRNNRMLGVVDKLNKLYGVRWGPVVGVRGWGLGMVDRWEGLKGVIMGQAGGG